MPIVIGGGGGSSYSPPTTRGVYDNGGPTTVPTATPTNLPWVFDYGDAVLNLTDPTQPLIIAAGVYAVTGWMLPGASYAGQLVTISLALGVDANADFAETQLQIDSPVVNNLYLLTGTYYCRTASKILANVAQNAMADQTWTWAAYIQRIT